MPSPIEARIIDLLRSHGPMIGREIVAEMPGFEAGCVRQLLFEMVMDQRLWITPEIRLDLPLYHQAD